jgi:hypothetical protein
MKKMLERTVAVIWHFDVSGNEVFGLHSGISGDVSGISGDVDDCEISDDDRKKGINIGDFIRNGKEEHQ